MQEMRKLRLAGEQQFVEVELAKQVELVQVEGEELHHRQSRLVIVGKVIRYRKS